MYPRPMNMVPNFSLGSGLLFGVSHMQFIIGKIIGKKFFFRDILIKSSHILPAIDPRPMNMVPNFSLGTCLSSYLHVHEY